MLTLIRSRVLRDLERSVTELHGRAEHHKRRADTAEHRITDALALLDGQGIPADHPLRLALTADQF
ncbi:hypothetical protein [Streptomyces sp. NPDC057238]|uniref:hypothetical protein n=1 Tax=Streptomyces sp. NPDC057238 TaxID=3346060 RepID=UPI003631484C